MQKRYLVVDYTDDVTVVSRLPSFAIHFQAPAELPDRATK